MPDPFRRENEAYIKRVVKEYRLETQFALLAAEAAGHTDISKFNDEEWDFFVEQVDPLIVRVMLLEHVQPEGTA